VGVRVRVTVGVCMFVSVGVCVGSCDWGCG
jgi:hypothetical protein